MISSELKKYIGEMFITGFEGKSLTKDVIKLFNFYHIGGYILFSRNISSIEQVFNLNKTFAKKFNNSLFACIDHEGGEVQRIKEPLSVFPPMHHIGKTESPEISRKVGEIMGYELGLLGFHLNFAPVCDLYAGEGHGGIGNRAFHHDPKITAELTHAFIEGMESFDVATCIKHFPGHGNASSDPHYKLPVSELPENEIEEKHIFPFRYNIENHKIPMVMVSHILYKSIDSEKPASVSKEVIDNLLRKKLNFKRVVITDELSMGAITKTMPVEKAVYEGLKTSVDIFLFKDIETCVKGIKTCYNAVKSGIIKEERFKESYERIKKIKSRYIGKALFPNDVKELNEMLDIKEHKSFVESLRDLVYS